MMFVFSTHQRAEYIRTLLLMRSASTEKQADALKELVDTYTNEMFPYQESSEWTKKQNIAEVLQREMERGPLAVVAEKS